jgi:hypothetical protein
MEVIWARSRIRAKPPPQPPTPPPPRTAVGPPPTPFAAYCADFFAATLGPLAAACPYRFFFYERGSIYSALTGVEGEAGNASTEKV